MSHNLDIKGFTFTVALAVFLTVVRAAAYVVPPEMPSLCDTADLANFGLPRPPAEVCAAEAAHTRGDYAGAVALLTPLAEAGDPSAEFDLGLMVRYGMGVSASDEDRGWDWIEKAARGGLARAQWDLGKRAEGPDPVAATRAYTWMRLAADTGYPPSMVWLGDAYLEGRIVPMDRRQAAEWYRKAGASGEPQAQEQAARGLRQIDPGAAAETFAWLLAAARQHYVDAMGPLGDRYDTGDGTPTDLVEAYKWTRLEQLHAVDPVTPMEDTEHLKKLAQKMSAREVERAEDEAKAWDAGPR